MLNDAHAMDVIRDAALKRTPFSFVRINDGEGMILAFDDTMTLRDLSYVQSHWGADRVRLKHIAQVKSDLFAAIASADMVGIRNDIIGASLPDHLLDNPDDDVIAGILASLQLRPGEREYMTIASARRLGHLHKVLTRTEWPEAQRYCSVWIHWEMLVTGLLNEVLEDSKEVGVITSKPELGELLSRRFRLKARVVAVPGKYAETRISGHVPDRYESIQQELTFPEGSLVLVGAGIPGKVYCKWLKERGCVALDVGSVFDAWLGISSRPRILESRFGVLGGGPVPPDLQLALTSGPADRRLVPRWKPSEIV